jgi:hypothetical protein
MEPESVVIELNGEPDGWRSVKSASTTCDLRGEVNVASEGTAGKIGNGNCACAALGVRNALDKLPDKVADEEYPV